MRALSAAQAVVRVLAGAPSAVGLCPSHDDSNPSFSASRGVDGRLLVHCHAGCPQANVIFALKAQGAWPRDNFAGAPTAYRQPAICPDLSNAPRETEIACDIWRDAMEITEERAAPARLYFQSRGIELPPDVRIRFCAQLWHPETRQTAPAVIVARHCPYIGLVRGVQRIYLTRDGRKYASGTAKLSLGRIEGGRAELMHGFEAKPLLIAEGCETALSAHQIFGGPAWAICGGFPFRIKLPESVDEVVLVADNDANGVSEKRARVLAKSIRNTGRSVAIKLPDTEGADANDILRGAA